MRTSRFSTEQIIRLTGELDQQRSEVDSVRELLTGSNADRDGLRLRLRELERRDEELPESTSSDEHRQSQVAEGDRRKLRQRKWWLRLFGIDEKLIRTR